MSDTNTGDVQGGNEGNKNISTAVHIMVYGKGFHDIDLAECSIRAVKS
jgi:hypothetical protein